MERWLKILLGTLFSSLGAIVFFFIYDKFLVHYRKKRHDKEDKPVMHMQHIFKKGNFSILITLNNILLNVLPFTTIGRYNRQ